MQPNEIENEVFDHDVTEELSDVLTAISVISKRLARKLTLLSEEEKTRGGKTDE